MNRKKAFGSILLILSLLLFAGCSEKQGISADTNGDYAALESEPQDDSGLHISELMTKNTAALMVNGAFPDWVELENRGEAPVTLTGYVLSDGSHSMTLPEVTLKSGQLLLLCSGEGEGCLPFSLSASDTLSLCAPDGTCLESVSCAGAEKNQSLVFSEEGNALPCLYPTPGYPNNDDGYAAFSAGLPLPADLRLSEVFVHGNSNAKTCDWVELYNAGEEELSLSTYTLSDDGDELSLLSLPEVSLAPGAYYLCKLEDTPFALNGENEELYLSCEGAILDYVSLRAIPPTASYGRGEDGSWLFLETPTPGSGNGAGFLQVSAAPVLLGKDGVFAPGESVSVSLEAPGEIYYTTDCSDPKVNGQLYTDELTIEKNTVLRTVAREEGKFCSADRVFSFFFEECSLPVVSLVGDVPEDMDHLKHMASQEPEVLAYLSLYEENGSFTLPCGVRLSGNYSLKIPEKSFKVYFRSAYGADGLSYDVFGTGVTHYHSLGLRKGMDSHNTVFKNELFESLALEFTDRVAVQHSKFCRMYINGAYWGLVSLREDFSSTYFSEYFGGDKDSVSYERFPPHKHNAFYQEVFAYVLEHKILNEESYNELSRRLDIDSVIDWVLVKGLAGDIDYYPNVAFFRSEGTGGLWRMAAWDFDWGFTSPFSNLTHPGREDYYSLQLGTILNALFGYEPFRERFLNRFAEAVQSCYTVENISAKIENYRSTLSEEVTIDYTHWKAGLQRWELTVNSYLNLVETGTWHTMILRGVSGLPGIRVMHPENYME